jgi:hypothetical protein
VVQIDFTSPSFKTEEGFGTDLKKVEGNSSAFAVFEIPWRSTRLRYQDKKGGLSFYVINADSSDEESKESKVTKVGSVHKGSRPIAEAFGLAQEPNAGWRPQKEAPGAPLAVRQLAPNRTSQKDLGGGYSYCQHTNSKGVVTSAEVLHGTKIVDRHAPANGAILPLVTDLTDPQGPPMCSDLDGDRVPDLALLFAEDTNPPSYLLRVTPLKGDKLQNKYYEKFYGKKPVPLPMIRTGQVGLLATDDSYVYSFGDVSNSPEPLIRVRWINKYPFKLSIDEMKKPRLAPDEITSLTEKLQRTTTAKDGVFRISQEFLQSVFDLIYSGRAEDAKKLISKIWPDKQLGQWSGGPLIERGEFWLEVTERLAESPFFEEIEKMNGETAKWQTAFK